LKPTSADQSKPNIIWTYLYRSLDNLELFLHTKESYKSISSVYAQLT
jgi:hypothetical protein